MPALPARQPDLTPGYSLSTSEAEGYQKESGP